MYHNTA